MAIVLGTGWSTLEELQHIQGLFFLWAKEESGSAEIAQSCVNCLHEWYLLEKEELQFGLRPEAYRQQRTWTYLYFKYSQVLGLDKAYSQG
jgi:hypothetical protein